MDNKLELTQLIKVIEGGPAWKLGALAHKHGILTGVNLAVAQPLMV